MEIDWSDPAIIAAIISGAFAIISGIFSWVVNKRKNKLEATLNAELETHKAELDRKSREIQLNFDVQLEKLHIEYGALYQERLLVIKQVYSKITYLKQLEYEINEQIARYMSNGDFYYKGTKHLESLLEKLNAAITDAESIFISSKIYFSKKDTLHIQQIIKLGVGFKDSYMYFMEQEIGYEDNNTIETFVKGNFTSLFGKELNTALTTIEERFRYLIGVETE